MIKKKKWNQKDKKIRTEATICCGKHKFEFECEIITWELYYYYWNFASLYVQKAYNI
jgi:hypothetical protein